MQSMIITWNGGTFAIDTKAVDALASAEQADRVVKLQRALLGHRAQSHLASIVVHHRLVVALAALGERIAHRVLEEAIFARQAAHVEHRAIGQLQLLVDKIPATLLLVISSCD